MYDFIFEANAFRISHSLKKRKATSSDNEWVLRSANGASCKTYPRKSSLS